MKQSVNPNQRVGIFVDVQNLYHSAKNLYGGRVNYNELMKHLVGDRQLIRAMAYVVKSEGIVEAPPRSEPIARTGRGRTQTAPLSSEAAFFEALEAAFNKTSDRPRVIIANTIKGRGVSFMEHDGVWHNKCPSEAQYATAIQELGANQQPISFS